MVSKKLVLALAFFLVIGTVAAITWFGGPSPDASPETPGNGTYGVNGTGYTSADLPGGILVDSVIPTPLIEEYDAVLQQSTFTMRITTSETINGSQSTVTTQYEKGESGIRITTTARGEVVQEIYIDSQNQTRFVCSRSTDDSCPTDVTSSGQPGFETGNLKALFIAGEWSPTDVNSNATYTETILETERLTDGAALEDAFRVSNVASFTGAAIVDERQAITDVNVTIEGTVRGHPTRIEYQTTVTRVNQTSVTAPDWVTESSSSGARGESGISRDDRTLFVRNSGAEYEAGATVSVLIDNGDYFETVETNLDSSWTKGEMLYVTLVDGGPRLYQNQIPTQRGDKLTQEGYVIRVDPVDSSRDSFTVSIRP